MKKLRALGQRWPWLACVLDVQDRVGEVNGGFVASAITVSVFLSLFPLVLVAIAVVGFLSAGDPNVSGRIIDSLALKGSAATTMRTAVSNAERSRQAASVLGFLGLVWSATGVTTAVQHGVRVPWQTSARGLRDRLVGLVWLVGGGVLFSASLALGAFLNDLPRQIPAAVSTVAVIAVGLGVEAGFFLWTFWWLGDRQVAWRRLLPGALVAAAGFEVLKLVGTVYVPRLVARSSSLYGPIGVVFAILVWLASFSRLLVYSSALNAVLYERTEGTVRLEIEVPDLPGPSAPETTRGGALRPPDPA